MMLDSRVLEAPLLDHRGLDLDAAGRVTYVLQQSFRYEYDSPVESLRQRLVVVPPARHGNQHRRAHRLDVHGVQARRSVRRTGTATWWRGCGPTGCPRRSSSGWPPSSNGCGPTGRRCRPPPPWSARSRCRPTRLDRGRRPAAGARGRPAVG